MGIAQSMSSLGRILGPMWGGYSFDALGMRWPFLSAGLVMLLAFLMSLRNLLNGKNHASPQRHTRTEPV
jgi:MFS family permease